MTETTEVKIDVPVPTGQDGDSVPAFDEAGEAQVAAAKKLVEDLKENGTLADLSESTHIPSPSSSSSKKRTLEKDEDEEEDNNEEDASGKLVDNRNFFSKLFRRKQDKKRKQKSTSPSSSAVAVRETKALPASRHAPEIVVREEGENGEGRRWAAGFGLAVAVGATAAAPYLFG